MKLELLGYSLHLLGRPVPQAVGAAETARPHQYATLWGPMGALLPVVTPVDRAGPPASTNALLLSCCSKAAAALRGQL